MERNQSPEASATHAAGRRPAIDRRTLLRGVAGAAALAVTVLGVSTATAGLAQYKATARVNLRSGPGTSYGVITVIPAGTILAHQGKSQNGFYEVGYGHTYGWVHKDYLTPTGGSTDPVIVGSAKATVSLNLRAGPSSSDHVLRVIPAGTWLKASNTHRYGYRYVIHNGLPGWVADQYLSWSQHGEPTGEVFTTTARLNLRSEPNTGAAVRLVIPSGAKVKALTGTANGWREVSYNGTAGWVSTNYLN